MRNNTTASRNVAIGHQAVYDNETGENLTAVGYQALSNSIAGLNSALGYRAGYALTTGTNNTAIGNQALGLADISSNNTAVGDSALYANEGAGIRNTALGSGALRSNTTGDNNVAIGKSGLYSNTNGNNNTALGKDGLEVLSSGSGNVGIGTNANDIMSSGVNTSGLGYNIDISSGLSNVTVLGYNTDGTASNQVRIGDAFVTSIGGYANWTNISDGRFKKEVNENVAGLDFIMNLRPVTYKLDINAINTFLGHDDDGEERDETDRIALEEKSKMIWTGFIAQEVEKAANEAHFEFSGIDLPKNENDHYGLRYAEFVVPIVKGMQEQQDEITTLRNEVEILKKLVQQMLKGDIQRADLGGTELKGAIGK